MKRRAVALLITLVFIAAALGFAALFFTRTNRAVERVVASESTLEINALLYYLAHSAIKELVKTAKRQAVAICAIAENKKSCQEKVMIEIYDIFYSLPLAFQIGKNYVNIRCSPSGTKPNINLLKIPDGVSEQDRDHIAFRRRDRTEQFLRDRYRLYASWQFFELLDFTFDTSGEKNAYLKNDKRLNVAKPNIERGRIGSPRQLYAIAQDYAILTQDESVLSIPWETLFSYESPNDLIDFNNMDREACKLVFHNMNGACDRFNDERVSQEDLTRRYIDANQTINDFSLTFGFNSSLLCNINYAVGKKNFRYSFYYDTNAEKLNGFRIIE
ncbi:MAG: hypothetical protein LBP89_03710 [Helicobacteraceae bacterium]|jgi:hypothetical protein|nr:hypothetical protein [Helicobacteraceae bacterium]